MRTESTRPRAPKGPDQATRDAEGIRDVEAGKREALNAIVGEQVLHALGEPAGLLMVQVRPLWERRYRVNVFTGGDAASALVAHSYFVVADGEGNVLEATPTIRRQY